MALPALATVEDAAVRLGRDLAPGEQDRLDALLRDASARIRAEVRQQITQGPVTQTARVRPGGLVRLTQSPFVSLTSVTDNQTQIEWPAAPYGPDTIVVGLAPGAVINLAEDMGQWPGYMFPAWVTVRYVAGWAPDEVPDIVRSICAQAANRALAAGYGVQPNAAGVGAPPPPGGVWLLSDEKAALNDAFPPLPSGPIGMYGPTVPEPRTRGLL